MHHIKFYTFFITWCLVHSMACNPTDVFDHNSPDDDVDSGTLEDAGNDNQDAGMEPIGLLARPSNATCVAWLQPTSNQQVSLEPIWTFANLTNPLWAGVHPSQNHIVYVIEQEGSVLRLDTIAETVSLVINLTGIVNDNFSETGLLGMALDPLFESNGHFYVSYVGGTDNNLVSKIVRYTSVDDGTSASPSSALTILQQPQPYWNHNGGSIHFGADNMLYIAFGDGGSGGDPDGNGQNTNTWLGKILRIDVRHSTAEEPYTIPLDNPFLGTPGFEPEIYAYGLRNPWRMSEDPLTGQLWVGDVGQNAYEEIDRIVSGGNYGWNTMEGFHCYESSNCDQTGLILPIVEYGHANGRASITGGYVYRGSSMPSLDGKYIFGDFSSGEIFTLDETTSPASLQVLASTNTYIASFFTDAQNELYVLSIYDTSGIFRVVTQDSKPDSIPEKLSLTGCVDVTDATKSAEGLIPYDVQVPFYADMLQKDRFIAVPDNTELQSHDDGTLNFPAGTVTMKTFYDGTKRIETRLLMKDLNNQWSGYSYLWNSEQTDATLLQAGYNVTLQNGTQWNIPSRNECMQCHTAQRGYTLAVEALQINQPFTYPQTDITANQWHTWKSIGLIADSAPTASELDVLPLLNDDSISLETRAKAYLHVNCAHCHMPGGAGQGLADMRYNTPFKEMSLCDTVPTEGDLGISGARLISPGNPENSILLQRMKLPGAPHMPPLGNSTIDEEGTSLIQAWIQNIDRCE
jgi:uncharacterized repeat protein (TIGR03806 family)